MSNNCWLPSLVLLSAFNNVWHDYEKVLYDIFKTDFIDSRPIFLLCNERFGCQDPGFGIPQIP
jgi:hypothetical protein